MLLKVIHPSNELLELSGDTFKDHALLTFFLFLLVIEERMDHYC